MFYDTLIIDIIIKPSYDQACLNINQRLKIKLSPITDELC